MDNENKFVQKSQKIRMIFGLDSISIAKILPERINYNENVFFSSTSSEKENISLYISTALNSLDKSVESFSTNSSQVKNNPNKLLPLGENNQNYQYFFIPCINCNNLIHINNIENHSTSCTKVNEEIIKLESSLYSYHSIDYKLRKLREHLVKIHDNIIKISNEDLSKDSKYFSSINDYIDDCLILSTINFSTITALKKIITNLNNLLKNYSGTFSTLLLIERTKVIVLEKLKIIKEDMKKIHETNKQNPQRKSEFLSPNNKLRNLENKKREILMEKGLQENKKLLQIQVYDKKTFEPSNTISKNSLCDKEKKDSNEQIEDLSYNNSELNNSGNYKLDEINSNIDILSQMQHSSDFTSGLSECSDTEKKNTVNEVSSYNNKIDDPKYIYKEFVKIFLKVKFENIHCQHRGQNIPQSLVWKEALRRNITKSQYEEFITKELNNTSKYDNKRNSQTLNNKYYLFILSKASMDTINEEN